MKSILFSILIIGGSATFAIAQTKKTFKPKPADDTMFLPFRVYDPDTELPLNQREKYALDAWVATIKAYFEEHSAAQEPPANPSSAAKNPGMSVTDSSINNLERKPR